MTFILTSIQGKDGPKVWYNSKSDNLFLVIYQ